jgi:Spy/CpxP family protein refolding chaperone
MASIAGKLGFMAAAFFATGVTACGGGAANNQSAVAAASPGADDETAGLLEHHRYHHHGGVTLFIAMSLETLGISPEQRPAVEMIRSDLHARMEPARVAEQGLEATLADGLAAGNIDVAKVNAGVAQVTATAAEVQGACADALKELHAALTPPQRAALVDKVAAHWTVWQKANADVTAPSAVEGSYLAMLATDLGLTPDQLDRIRAGLATKAAAPLDLQEIATRLGAFGDAFRSETFDPGAITTASDANAHMIAWGAAHMAYFVEAVSPVLTPDQRANLAQRLREHASHDPSVEANL